MSNLGIPLRRLDGGWANNCGTGNSCCASLGKRTRKYTISQETLGETDARVGIGEERFLASVFQDAR